MLDTDSALLDFIAAPFLAAELHSRPMLDTDSALLDMFVAPFFNKCYNERLGHYVLIRKKSK